MVKKNYKKNQQLENLLDILGLRGKERDVFSLCFFSGPLPASVIAKELNINRAAVYQIINQLIEKEVLQKENISGKKQLFNSVSVEEIKGMLLQQQKQISEIQNQLPTLLLDKKIQKDSDSLSVETFSTSLSLKQMLYRAMDNSKSKMYLIASVDSPYNIYEKKVFDSFLKELSQRKITLYILVPREENAEKNSMWNRESIKVKFLEKSDYPFSDGLLISDKFLFMFSWNPQNPKGLMISDKTIRQTYLSLFLLLWEKTIYSEQKTDDKKVFPSEMQLIPGGYFYSGEESSAKKIFLDSYLIDKTPVTNAEYQKFVKTTGYHFPEHWKNGQIPKGEENHPVYNVSWYDAKAYANFSEKRLPTEEEWEKAARGSDKRIYPWGNNFDVNFCNILRKNKGTTPVEKYPLGKSYYGLYDMAGNVWEWTDTPADEKNFNIIKGGSWADNEKTAQCFYKTSELSDKKYDNIGFRCAKDII
jgi:formylglycine-generating enzyme required for sulfatase activity/predicted transcriptional regulator